MTSYNQNSMMGLIFPGFAVALTLIATAGSVWYAQIEHEQILHERASERYDQLIQAGGLVVVDVGEDLPGSDPFSELWDQAPVRVVPVQPQQITKPMLDSPTIASVRVQGLTDGRWIAWRLQWDDASADMNVDTDRFCDAVAIQFPLVANASPYMGGRQMPVQIIHWKALWQKDIDEHFQDVQDLYPNYWADLYWFAEHDPDTKPGEARYRVPVSFQDPRSLAWFPAYQAHNPMADFNRIQPVQELYAEGYGTLTPQKNSESSARGIWRDGVWTVVFARPLHTDDPLDSQFQSAAKRQMSVAIWEGSSQNVGGRKHWSQWFPFSIGVKP